MSDAKSTFLRHLPETIVLELRVTMGPGIHACEAMINGDAPHVDDLIRERLAAMLEEVLKRAGLS